MLSGHSDFKSLTLRYKWALCHGPCFCPIVTRASVLLERSARVAGPALVAANIDGFDLRGIVRELTKGTITRRLSIRASHTSMRGDAVRVSRSVGSARLVLALSSLADLKGPVHPLLRQLPILFTQVGE
jgi:hypothetical protein